MNYSISNDFLTVTISDHGAELQSILGADGTEYLWQGDPKYWRGRAINLFPYVARLNKESYYLDGKLYHMPIHGIAMYSDFAVTEQTPDHVIFELCSNEDSLVQYPRSYRFQIRYALEEKKLAIAFVVENTDRREMIFGIGGHPGFNVPFGRGRFEETHIQFAAEDGIMQIDFNADCHPTGTEAPFLDVKQGRLELKHDLFDYDAIVLRGTGGCATLRSEEHAVTVEYPQMPYLGIWHMPHTDAPYVCIEPWCSLPSKAGEPIHFEEQEDLIHLDAGATYINEWSITVE